MRKLAGLDTLFAPCLFVLGLVALALVYLPHLPGFPDAAIRSDGLGYYAYVPAALLDRDLSMATLVQRSFGGVPPDGLLVAGALRDKYPIGTALLQMPFFALGHAAAYVTHQPRDGFSAPYQCAIAVAGLTYGVLGLHVLRSLLEQVFKRGAGLPLIVVTFGTNLFHYLTYDSGFSHAYSFFLITSFLALVLRFERAPDFKNACLLGATAGFIVLVRPTNAVVFALLPLYGVIDRVSFSARIAFLRQAQSKIVIAALIAAALVSLQLTVWKLTSGHWLFDAYTDERFFFASPKPLAVLFSLRKGLFFWSPVTFIAVLGFVRLARKRPGLWIAIAPTLVLQLYLVSSWWCWWYGGSFGHRAFTEYAAFFAFGLAAWREAQPRWFVPACVLATTYSIVMMGLYWVRVIPFAGWADPIFG